MPCSLPCRSAAPTSRPRLRPLTTRPSPPDKRWSSPSARTSAPSTRTSPPARWTPLSAIRSPRACSLSSSTKDGWGSPVRPLTLQNRLSGLAVLPRHRPRSLG